MSETISELESRLTRIRVLELWHRPPPDKFDVAALRETHRYIFQDFAKYDLTNPPPGLFRGYVGDQGDWQKMRELLSISEHSFACYAPMTESDLRELDQVLKGANPAKLRQLDRKEFATAVSDLYAHLDYIHPFHEGNSRALRTFTSQLARSSGYHLDWERFNHSAKTRDLLCIARDRAVNEIAIPRVRNDANRREMTYYTDKFAGNPGLLELIQAATRPVTLAAPRHDPSKDQAQIHTTATVQKAENIEALKRNPSLAGLSAEDLDRLAYWRGVLRESTKTDAQEATLNKFDRIAAENPASLLAKLDKSADQPRTHEHASARSDDLSL